MTIYADRSVSNQRRMEILENFNKIKYIDLNQI